MTVETIDDRFVLRAGYAADLAAVNEVPLDREIVIERDTGLADGKRKFKVGDGVTAWNDLPYFTTGGGKWGELTGTLSDQADLQAALDAKADAAGIQLDGRESTYAELPTTELSPGDAYLVDTDQKVYVWDGSAFPASGAGVSVGGGRWVKVASWSQADNGNTASVIANVAGYNEVMVIVHDVTMSASGWRYVRVSCDGGATYDSVVYRDVDDNGVTDQDVGNIVLHSTASAASRSGCCVIPIGYPSGMITPIITPARTLHTAMVVALTAPIDHVMVYGSGTYTGGYVQIWAR